MFFISFNTAVLFFVQSEKFFIHDVVGDVMKKVAKDLVVSLAYKVRTEDDVLVDESLDTAPLDYLHGRGSLISGLEKALEGRSVGEHFDIEIQADDAYGQYDENLVQRVPKDVFVGVDELQVGMRFLADIAKRLNFDYIICFKNRSSRLQPISIFLRFA